MVNSIKAIFLKYMMTKCNHLSRALIAPVVNQNFRELLAPLWGMALALMHLLSCFGIVASCLEYPLSHLEYRLCCYSLSPGKVTSISNYKAVHFWEIGVLAYRIIIKSSPHVRARSLTIRVEKSKFLHEYVTKEGTSSLWNHLPFLALGLESWRLWPLFVGVMDQEIHIHSAQEQSDNLGLFLFLNSHFLILNG